MASLRSGDYVMDGPASYTRVIVNQHAAVSLTSPLLELASDAPTVSLTPDHVLSVDGRFVPARLAAVGSHLGEHVVTSLTSTSGPVINPLTASGKILVQGNILATTYPEWIADYMLSSYLVPLPVSFSNLISYLFPETTQAYYDAVVESLVTAHHPMHLKAALSKPLVPVAIALADVALAAGFAAFALASPMVVVAGAAAAIVLRIAAAKAARK